MCRRSIERSRCRYNREVMCRDRVHRAGSPNREPLNQLRGGGVEETKQNFPIAAWPHRSKGAVKSISQS
jgi:hypothetical protein